MPTYDITAPDGKVYEVTAPSSATQDEVLAYAKQQLTPTMQQDQATWSDTRSQQAAYADQVARQAIAKDLAAGGSIRQAPVEPNFPVGAVVGGVAGTFAAGPAGGVAGTIIGEAAQQGLEHLAGDPAAPQSGMEAAKRLTQESVYGLAGEGLARGAVALRGGGPFASRVTPEAQQAMQTIQGYTGSAHPGLLPAEATDSRVLDVLQNISESSLLGGGAIKRFKEDRAKVFENMADRLVDQFGSRMSADDAGRAVVDAAKGNLEIATMPAKMTYSALETAAADATVNLGEVKQSIQGMLKIAREAGGLEDRAMGKTLLEFINSKPDAVSYPVAKAIRTEIRTLKDSLEKSIENKNAPAIGKARMLYGQLTEKIREGLRDTDPFLADMWDEANQIERQGQADFNNRLIRSLARKASEEGGGRPEAIARELFKANNVTAIERVRKAVDPSTWEQMQSVAMQDLMAKAVKKETGMLDGVKLEDAAFGRGGLGPKAMAAAFDPQQIASLKGLTNALKVAQEKSGEGTGRVLIQLAQGGALLDVAGNELGLIDTPTETGSAAILLTPAVLGKLMTNPTTARWLIRGFNTSADAKEAAVLGGRILSAAFPRLNIRDEPPSAPVLPPRTRTPGAAMPMMQ